MRDKPGYIVLVAVGINQNVPNISQGTLFFAETKVLNFSLSLRLRSQTHKFFNVRLSKCKQNKYVMNDVAA